MSDKILKLSQAQTLYQDLRERVDALPTNEDIPEVPVQDVQVNGTSILNNGVAIMPLASSGGDFGLVKIAYDSNGLTIDSNGILKLVPATEALIKNGSAYYRAAPTVYQHNSVFYGLAKAAGADMANIANTTVGTYPDAQKEAIQSMLGITQMLAPENPNLIASQAYAVGEVFAANGHLYKATAAIAQDGAIITDGANANCVETNVGEGFVKNTDYAAPGKYGTVMIGTQYGIGLSGGFPAALRLLTADSARIKAGTETYWPLAPAKQHESVFYGFAKAAGTDEKDSTLPVGQYTDTAKAAIKSMIGVGEEAYFINKKDFTNPTTVNSNASSVINAALIAAKATGKNYCIIPEGEYWLTETIYLQDSVILKGCGMDATTLKIADGCDIDAIRVASPINNSGVMDLSIDGNRITNYSTFNNGHHGNAINVWLHYGRIERVRTNWVYKHSLLLNYDTGNSDDGLGFDSEHQNDIGNLNKVLWCDFRDSLLQGVMWGWRTMDSWMCYTNIGSHAANLYLEGGTSRFIGNHFDGDGDNGAGPEYNVYCGDGCKAMLFDGNIFENTQKQNIFFRQPSYSNQTMTITISNNIIRTCSKSQNEQYSNIYISGYSDSVKATEIAITGNQILNPDKNANHGYAGIHLVYCENCKIVGNTFFNVGGDDVIIDNTCDNVLNDSALPKDIQINGTSVVSNGVANIPFASASVYGVAKTDGSKGTYMPEPGVIGVAAASEADIKSGNVYYRPIIPVRQHASVFYGLAKAAGDNTQSASSNSVGTYTDDAKAAIKSMIGVNVEDVQVNGTSVISNGIATVPIAVQTNSLGEGQYGLVKINSSNGITIAGDGCLSVNRASETQYKGGNNNYLMITPYGQHMAVFYGLAKAAGDTTQSTSSNTVGTYTDSAKASIKAMLGIQDGSTSTVDISGTDPVITAVENTRYVCGEVTSLSFTPPASGISIVRFTSGSTVTVLTIPSTVKFPEWFDPTSLETNTIYEICVTDGVYGAVMSWVL